MDAKAALVAWLTVMVYAASTSAQHTGDVWVGVTPANQMAVSTNAFVPEDNFAPLRPVDGLIKGWSDNDPGFDRVTSTSDVSPLAAGAEIWLEVVEMDPAFQAIDNGFKFLRNPGDDTLLGGPNPPNLLHTHLIWHINNQDLAFDPEQCVWQATFILRDDGTTGYTPSAPLEFSFTNVPVRALGVPATGDFDESGMIDEIDFAALAACLNGGGPDRLPEPYEPGVTTCAVECLNAFDFDDDRDVDLRDIAAFQRAIP